MNFGDLRLPETFWDKCIPEPNSGCWLWLASCRAHGYGQSTVNGKVRAAHVQAYLAKHGSIEAGLELDHLCRTPSCCNPAHLEAVTHRENMRRSHSPTGLHAQQTQCSRGHALVGDNLRTDKNGWRICRECSRLHNTSRSDASMARRNAYNLARKKAVRAGTWRRSI